MNRLSWHRYPGTARDGDGRARNVQVYRAEFELPEGVAQFTLTPHLRHDERGGADYIRDGWLLTAGDLRPLAVDGRPITRRFYTLAEVKHYCERTLDDVITGKAVLPQSDPPKP